MASKQTLNVLVVDHDEGSKSELKDFRVSEGHRAEVLTAPDQVPEPVHDSGVLGSGGEIELATNGLPAPRG